MTQTSPEHTPIVPCPTCGRHTAHTMPTEGSYRCSTCATVHGLERAHQVALEQEPCWCPVCRRQDGGNFWAAVEGKRQCRACLTWVTVATKPGEFDA